MDANVYDIMGDFTVVPGPSGVGLPFLISTEVSEVQAVY